MFDRLAAFVLICCCLQAAARADGSNEEEHKLLASYIGAHMELIDGLREFDCLVEIRYFGLRQGGDIVIERMQRSRLQSLPDRKLIRCVSRIEQDVDSTVVKTPAEQRSVYKGYKQLVYCSLQEGLLFMNDFNGRRTRPGRESITPELSFYTSSFAPRLHRTALDTDLVPGSSYLDKEIKERGFGSRGLMSLGYTKVKSSVEDSGKKLFFECSAEKDGCVFHQEFEFDTSLNLSSYRMKDSKLTKGNFFSRSSQVTFRGSYGSQTVPRWQTIRDRVTQDSIPVKRDEDNLYKVRYVWLDASKDTDDLWKVAADDPVSASRLLDVRESQDIAEPIPGYEKLPTF